MEFCEQVYQAVREHDLIRRGDRVLAAVSGGADSVCLLLVLDKIRQDLQKQGKPSFELALVTVDHGIRGEASAGDVAFADQLGRRLGLPCFVFHEDVPALVRQEHLSEEEAARAVRYRCFAKAARKWQADSVAVAHNKDDQVETVLLNLLRGSGLTGLAGLSWSRTLKTSGPEFGPIVQEPGACGPGFGTVVQEPGACGQECGPIVQEPGDCSQECGAGGSPGGEEMDEIRVIRPLLDMSRGEIEAWLSQIGQPFRTDESNLEDHHTRNRLRHHVIPLMEQEINRNAREHIASAASDLAQAAAFAESSAAEWLEKHEALDWFSEVHGSSDRFPEEQTVMRIRVPAEKLGSLNQLVSGQVVLLALKKVSPGHSVKDIGRVHVRSVLGLVKSRSGASLPLPGGLKVRREYGMLVFEAAGSAKSGSHAGITEKTDNGFFARELDAGLLSQEPLIIETPGRKRISLRISSYNKEKKLFHDCTNCFDYDKIKNSLTLRNHMQGDFFLLEQGGKKKLKAYFADQKIPAHERDGILILADGSHVMWIMESGSRHRASGEAALKGRPPGRVTAAYKVSSSTRRILELRLLPDEEDSL